MKNFVSLIPVAHNGCSTDLLKFIKKYCHKYFRSIKWFFGAIKISLNIYSVVTNVVTTAIVKFW